MDRETSPLYLLLPHDAGADFMRGALARLLQQVDVAALLLWAGAERGGAAKAALEEARRAAVPLLLAGPIAAVLAGDGDGVHVEGAIGDLTAFRAKRVMAGAGGLWNRHDAMVAGERGADYVFFGSADPARSVDSARILELTAWWAALFEVPCVAMASNFAEAESLLAAGADFIAMREAVWSLGAGASEALSAFLNGAARARETAR